MADFNRRRVLRGVLDGGAVTVALPLLNCFLNGNGTAMADGVTLPHQLFEEQWEGAETGTGATTTAVAAVIFMSDSGTCKADPVVRMTERSIRFSSSRTFPGQCQA